TNSDRSIERARMVFEVPVTVEMRALPRLDEASPGRLARIAARERELEGERHPVADREGPKIREVVRRDRAEHRALLARHVHDRRGHVDHVGPAGISFE